MWVLWATDFFGFAYGRGPYPDVGVVTNGELLGESGVSGLTSMRISLIQGEKRRKPKHLWEVDAVWSWTGFVSTGDKSWGFKLEGTIPQVNDFG